MLAKSKGKITTDELCLWLSSEVKSAAKKSKFVSFQSNTMGLKGKCRVTCLHCTYSYLVTFFPGPPHMINLESRSWKPQSKKETGLSLHLNQRLTKQGVESISK